MSQNLEYAKQIISGCKRYSDSTKSDLLLLWKYLYKQEGGVDIKADNIDLPFSKRKLGKLLHKLQAIRLAGYASSIHYAVSKEQRENPARWDKIGVPMVVGRCIHTSIAKRKKPIAQSPARGYVQRRNGVIIMEKFDD